MRFALAAVLCSLLVAPQAMAQAEANDLVIAARQAFRAGTSLTKTGQWVDALAAYERSASLHAHATTTFNIAYCERALGHYTRARTAFARAQTENTAAGGDELSATLRVKAEGYSTEIDRKLARLQVTVWPAGAAISIDGRPLDAYGHDGAQIAGTRDRGAPEPVARRSFDVLVDPGDHTVLLLVGTKEETRRLDVAAGEVLALDLHHSGARHSGARHSGARVEPTTPPGATAAYVAWGLGGTGVLVGVIAGAIALDRRSELDDRCPQRAACPTDAEDDIALMQSASDVSTVGFVLYLTADAGSGDVAIRAAPGSVSLGGRF